MTPPKTDVALIVGAGPAGCSCAAWLALLGIPSILIERATRPMDLLHRLHLSQDWVLGFPNSSTSDIATAYTQHVRSFQKIQIRCNETQLTFGQLTSTQKEIFLSDNTRIEAAALVFATGLRARRATPYTSSPSTSSMWDAVTLTQQREPLKNKRILLLGGGDNAVENAIFLSERGNQVVLWSKSPLRAQARFTQQLSANPRIECRIAMPLPHAVDLSADHWVANSASFGTEHFDHAAALFGYEPEDDAWQHMLASAAWHQQAWPRPGIENHATLQALGVFVCGDVSQRWHPCIQTAVADGVTTAKQVADWLQAKNEA